MQAVRKEKQTMENACVLVNYKIVQCVGHYGLHMNVHDISCSRKLF